MPKLTIILTMRDLTEEKLLGELLGDLKEDVTRKEVSDYILSKYPGFPWKHEYISQVLGRFDRGLGLGDALEGKEPIRTIFAEYLAYLNPSPQESKKIKHLARAINSDARFSLISKVL